MLDITCHRGRVVRTTMRRHLAPVGAAVVGERDALARTWRVGRRRRECQQVQPRGKQVEGPHTVKRGAAVRPSGPASAWSPEGSEAAMVPAASFSMAEAWTPKCPGMDEWVKRLRHTRAKEYSSATKKEKENPAIWDSTNGPRRHYAKPFHYSIFLSFFSSS